MSARVAALVEQRAEMFEAMAPTWRAARLQEPFSPQIRSNRDRLMALGREHVAATFAPELAASSDDTVLLDALHGVTSWATWESLRNDLKLDPAAACAVLLRVLHGLLETTDAEEARR